MKVHELMELLSSMNPDAEVRLANQPNWPLQHSVRGAVSVANLVEHTVWNGDPTEPCPEHAPKYPCGHDEITRGCGGCDPGAIEFVIEDDGTTRPFDPKRDLQEPGRD